MRTNIFIKQVREEYPFRSWKSIRNKSLQKLLFLHHEIFNGELNKPLKERSQKAKEYHTRKHSDSMVATLGFWPRKLTDFLKPEDVMRYLHCNYRTAQDYIYTLRALFSS